MHKKLTRIWGTSNFRVENCGCSIGANHDDKGTARTITATVGTTLTFAQTGLPAARLTEINGWIAAGTG